MTDKKVVEASEASVVESSEPALERANDAVRVFVYYKPACRVEFKVEASSSLVKKRRSMPSSLLGKKWCFLDFVKERLLKNLC
jgi:hypothetical protein